MNKNEIKKRVDFVLDAVNMYRYRNRLASNLSGGERQRVGIARALVKNPPIIIADEPTGNLDPVTSMEIMKVLENINNLGTTIIMATHDKAIVDKMKKQVITLKDGRLVNFKMKGTYNDEAI